MDDSTGLETASSLAVRLGIQPRTILSWARSGRIPSVRVTPKVIRFDWGQVLDAIKADAGIATEGPEAGR